MPISAEAMMAIALSRRYPQTLFWVTANTHEMDRLHESIETLRLKEDRNPLFLKPSEKDPAIKGDHLKLARLLKKGKQPLLIISCLSALETTVPNLEQTNRWIKELKTGENQSLSDLIQWITEAGYSFCVEVYSPGEVALRGGILDIWSPSLLHPIRIEFFGDFIESIRYFDDQTQCSIEKISSVEIERLDIHKKIEDAILLTDLLPKDRIWIESASFNSRSLLTSGFDFYNTKLVSLSLGTSPNLAEQMRLKFVKERCKEAIEGWEIHFFFETRGTFFRFIELYKEIQGFEKLQIHQGVLHESAINNREQILLITESDFYAYHLNRYAHSREAKHLKKQERVSEAADIQPGDFVVHVEHGIGRYLGIVETLFAGKHSEVLCIEYAKGEKVYLPVTQAHLLTRYKALNKQKPKLHTLGGRKWIQDKRNAQEAIEDLAARLLQTQAERQARRGFKFSKDSSMQSEFEAAFPYTETPDQQTASEEIKQDMQKARPMDRLLCGDVGFGKTEVAMRAAFKAVQDKKQVAVLVPTTVLAQQHFESFSERMAPFPVQIDMVSRFRTRKQQTQTLHKTKEGEIDILIGTHRLLSNDVCFKDLGLVIIDEEQRFGVEAKERLKTLRTRVDLITMSATPIPRTLYMGITGVRDLSIIQTPPQERQPIDTIVTSADDKIIQEAIRLELHRNGQVFYLHNRVKSIHHIENKLRALVPEARIAVAHGQMGKTELSETMHAFIQGQYDVLLCTTIIENGVDIPNCNTIIIENADRFGLSDLYQLRGRVGRSTTKAFAYMLPSIGNEKVSSATDRLQAIQKHSGLGAGFRLAMRDLELRGAGNLLGAKQSGHISAVGFDLYCQLLQRSIALLRGKRPPPLMDVTIQLDFLNFSPTTNSTKNGAYIPYEYIEDENLRLRLYQRISALKTRQEIRLIKREMKDRFGKLPAQLQRLMLIAELRIVAAEKEIKTLIVKKQTLLLSKKERLPVPYKRLPDHITQATKKLKTLIEIISKKDFS